MDISSLQIRVMNPFSVDIINQINSSLLTGPERHNAQQQFWVVEVKGSSSKSLWVIIYEKKK